MVLDPFSAISLGGNIIQFIVFSFSILSETSEIYHSVNGAPSETLELQVVAEDLRQLIDPIRKARGAAQPSDPLSAILKDCDDVAIELLDLIQRIKGKDNTITPRAWKSLRMAVLAALKKEKRVDLEGRLRRLREEILFHSHIIIRCVDFLYHAIRINHIGII